MKNILKSNVKTVLLTLLLVDTLFVIVHVVHILIDRVLPGYHGFLLSDMFALDKDGGYPEIFQYMQELAIVLMLGLLYWRRKFFIYLAWDIFFLFLLLDDSLQFHETLGETVNNLIAFPSIGGIRGQDIGEVMTTAVIGAFLLGVVLYGYLKGSPLLRAFTHRMIVLVGLLIATGVLVDLVHFVFADSPIWFNL
ncbi:MAG: hypothetical protein P8183_22645, partial [Anaerolineae bacterium]